MNALRFSATIRFVSRDEFKQQRQKEQATPIREKTRQSIAVFDDAGSTEGIQMCVGGGVNNGQRFALFHYYDGDVLAPQLVQVRKQIQTLKAEDPVVSGLLVGGQFVYDFSRELAEGLSNLFQWEDVPFSAFLGQNKSVNASDVMYSKASDTWTVATAYRDSAQGKARFVDSLDALKEAFQTVKVDSNDTVELGGRRYSAEQVNHFVRS